MSYCRFSSDFGECDVYVYEHVGGFWRTHVAGRRLKQKAPYSIKNMPCETGQQRVDRHLDYLKWRDSLKDNGEEEWITLSEISEFAGRHFNDETPGDCADLLEKIRASGLNVPQHAIDDLREDQAEMEAGE